MINKLTDLNQYKQEKLNLEISLQKKVINDLELAITQEQEKIILLRKERNEYRIDSYQNKLSNTTIEVISIRQVTTNLLAFETKINNTYKNKAALSEKLHTANEHMKDLTLKLRQFIIKDEKYKLLSNDFAQ